jgi:DNA-binding response OmpR family regulator
MKRCILVVDDEVQIQSLLTTYFSKQGFEVSRAATSAETLRTAKEVPIDLVVLDIDLGQDDGMQLLATLKKTYPKTKVIMLTGMGFVEGLLQEAQAKGADGYVSKSLPLNELLAAVHRVLQA